MPQLNTGTYTAFVGPLRIASGSLQEVALAAKAAEDVGAARLVVFDDATGRPMELDLRGSSDEVLSRLPQTGGPPAKPAGRGRPKLGVTSREITLLPSHWDWLATQPGGASAALRRLVDQARRSGLDELREAQEAARRVMLTLAGDAPAFEEATRAFYAREYDRFNALSTAWPSDVGEYVRALVRRVAVQEEAAGQRR